MNTSTTQDVLAEVWAIKDSLSASLGHNLKATCRALYAEQAKHPADFVNLGTAARQNKVLESIDYLRERAASADFTEFDRIMALIPKGPIMEGDEPR